MNVILISVSFNFRTESSQLRARRLLPLLAAPIDTDDGGHMVDDDMQALLPNNESLSREDLNQVCNWFYIAIDVKILSHKVKLPYIRFLGSHQNPLSIPISFYRSSLS